jgi:hypothetical protein
MLAVMPSGNPSRAARRLAVQALRDGPRGPANTRVNVRNVLCEALEESYICGAPQPVSGGTSREDQLFLVELVTRLRQRS